MTLNVWEAVYFNHDERTLLALAEAAAMVGVERYVLDDGWFGSPSPLTRWRTVVATQSKVSASRSSSRTPQWMTSGSCPS